MQTFLVQGFWYRGTGSVYHFEIGTRDLSLCTVSQIKNKIKRGAPSFFEDNNDKFYNNDIICEGRRRLA